MSLKTVDVELSCTFLWSNGLAAEQAPHRRSNSSPNHFREEQKKPKDIETADGDESPAHRFHVHGAVLCGALLTENISAPPFLRPALHQTRLLEGLHAGEKREAEFEI